MYFLEYPDKIFLVFIYIIFIAWIQDIYEVERYLPAIDQVILIILACAEIHVAIYLPGICTDDFTLQLFGQTCGKSCFPPGGMTQHCDKVIWNVSAHRDKDRKEGRSAQMCYFLLTLQPDEKGG